jgi:CheY-like chemotaxis protein
VYIMSKQAQILIVDDDEEIRSFLGALLEDEGYQVESAEDGLAALEKLEKVRPDLILLDIMMPRMDGYGFAEALRQQGLQPPIPFIVLSANLREQQAKSMGAHSFIAKPFDLLDLLEKIDQCTS